VSTNIRNQGTVWYAPAGATAPVPCSVTKDGGSVVSVLFKPGYGNTELQQVNSADVYLTENDARLALGGGVLNG